MSSHSQPRSRPSAPLVAPHLSVWGATLQAVLLCLTVLCLGMAVQLGHAWLQQTAPLANATNELLYRAGLWLAMAVILLGGVLWWRAQYLVCSGSARVVDVLLEQTPAVLESVALQATGSAAPAASALPPATTTDNTPCLTPPQDLVAWGGWQALQNELLRGLPGPAMLVERTAGGWRLLDRNEDARATLPTKPTPALDRLITDLVHQAEATHRADPVALTEAACPVNTSRLLALPSGCSILWLPPSRPECLTTAAASAPTTPLPPPITATDEDRAALVYTVSHDLRAPIRVIEGFTRILVEDYGHVLDRVGNDHLERILGAAARMNSMIDALLDLSRLSTQELKHEPVDLSALATQVQLELQQQTPQRQAQWRITPGLQVHGDPTLLHSVMENLLGNAWKYTARRELTRIEFGQTESRGQTVFFVRDNGAGFDMRFAGKLFGAFQRLHGATEFAGTGIGLASVRRILRRHGGDIWAEGVVNEGATFYFTLNSLQTSTQTPGSANCSTA